MPRVQFDIYYINNNIEEAVMVILKDNAFSSIPLSSMNKKVLWFIQETLFSLQLDDDINPIDVSFAGFEFHLSPIERDNLFNELFSYFMDIELSLVMEQENH